MSDESVARPSVSIIIPAYNAGEYLDACLQSVFDQTRGDFELIVVDDGSTDDTPQILERYREKANLRVIRQENAGLSAARNRGMDDACGEYLCFLDADDALEPEYVKALLERAEQTGADVVTCGYTLWEGNQRLGEYPAAKWDVLLGETHVSLMCVVCTRLYSTAFLRGHNIRFIPGEYLEDVGFSLRVNLLVERIENVPVNYYRYLKHQESITARLRRGEISADKLPRRTLADAISYLVPRCDTRILEFCVVKIMAGLLFENLRRNPIQTVDAFSGFCAHMMNEHFPDAAKNPYISLFSPKSLPFIQRAAMKVFVITWKTRTLRAFACAFTRL